MSKQPGFRQKHPILEAIALAFVLVIGTRGRASAQQLSTPIDSNAVMGFETPAAWAAKSSTSSGIKVSSTTTRTQGNFAYAITNPGNLVTMTSAPVASTATALTGVGNPGALFQVDVMLPAQVGNVTNTGQMQMFVNSPSRGLSKVLVGDVVFSPFRPGIYNTLKFPIPAAVGAALGGANFTDLTFILMVSSPGTGAGTYLLDNLRVHSVQLVDATVNTQPPPGYGGSVDFVVFGGTPVAHQFNIGVVQVPENFHLKHGTAPGTTVELDLGYDGTASFTCIYSPDTTDVTGKSYALASCTGGLKAGDLVGANWANLNILGGDPLMKIRAQLALNPVGDTAGAGIIPPMPTFWGDVDGCVPTRVAPGVAPPFAAVPNPNPPPAWIANPSASCAAQTGQANQIVTNYSNQFLSSQVPPVLNTQFPPDWVVPPTPELARRHGNGTPINLTLPPPPGDPDFHYEGHVNDPPGGDWDAYYVLDGHYEPGQLQSQPVSSHFDASMEGHVVLFGNDVNVVTVTANADGKLDPTNGVSGSGSVSTYVFGQNIPGLSTSGGGSVPVPAITLFDVHGGTPGDGPGFSIHIWIFEIEVDTKMTAGLDASGKLDLAGLHFSFGPSVDVDVEAKGGVDVGFASGGVDVQMPGLFQAGIMANADATWSISTDPRQCSIGAKVDLSATADISSGGGHVNLVASFGKCPFCIDHSWDVFDWAGLGDTGQVPLFDPLHQQIDSVELPSPTTTCSTPLNVSITPPPTYNGQLELQSSPRSWPFQGSALSPNAKIDVCNGHNNPPNESVTFSWSGFNPGDSVSGANTCSPTVQFAMQPANTTSTRTITFQAEWDVVDPFGTKITEKNPSPPVVVTVTPPTPGPQITFPTASTVLYNPASTFPGSLLFCGIVVGVPATTSVSVAWSATKGMLTATTILPGGLGQGGPCDYPQIWTYAPSDNDTATITLTARDAMGNLFGSPATVVVNFVTTH